VLDAVALEEPHLAAVHRTGKLTMISFFGWLRIV
jgi:hypothetical protein